MLCDVCKKNPAKIHVTQVKDNKKYSIHICQECAHEKGVAGPAINTSFSVEHLLSGLFQSKATSAGTPVSHETCPSCGLSYSAFKESGRLGCSLCYDTFSEPLKPLLQKVQREMKHIGKTPNKGDTKLTMRRGISDLRLQLKEAVNIENFEAAARLRDQIRTLEKELGESGESPAE